MAKTVTITLREPIIGHQGAITEVVVREPRGPDYMRHGEFYTWLPAGADNYVRTDNEEAQLAYSECCVVEPKDKNLLQQVSLADQMAIKDAIGGFFYAARQALQPPNSPTS
jgi:hypothetical protein